MRPYNTFHRNNAQVIQRYNSPSSRHAAPRARQAPRLFRESRVIIKKVSNQITPSALATTARSMGNNYAGSNSLIVSYVGPVRARESYKDMENYVNSYAYSSGIKKVLVVYNSFSFHGTNFYRFAEVYMKTDPNANNGDNGDNGNGGNGDTGESIWTKIVNWFKNLTGSIGDKFGSIGSMLSSHAWILPVIGIIILLVIIKR